MARTPQIICYLTLRSLPCWTWTGPHSLFVISLWEDCYVDYGQHSTGCLLSHFEKTAMLTLARTLQVICYLTLRIVLCRLWSGLHRLCVISLWENCYSYYGQDATDDCQIDEGQDPTGCLMSNFVKTAMLTKDWTPHVVCNLTLRRLPCWIWPGPRWWYVISLSEDCHVNYGKDPTCYLLSHLEKTALLTMARTPQVIFYLILRRLLCWIWPWPPCYFDYG